MAEFNLLGKSNFPIVNEATLDEVLFTFLLLLGLKVCGVGGVTLLTVTVLALNDVIILSLLHHDDLVNAPLSSCSDGPNVQSYILTSAPLASIACGHRLGFVTMRMIMIMVMLMSTVVSSLTVLLVEWKCSPQVLALSLSINGVCTSGCQDKEAKLKKEIY